MTDHIEPNQIEFNSQFNAGIWSVDWPEQVKAWADLHGIAGVKIVVTEIIHWDITLMRGFLHAKVLPAFINGHLVIRGHGSLR